MHAKQDATTGSSAVIRDRSLFMGHLGGIFNSPRRGRMKKFGGDEKGGGQKNLLYQFLTNFPDVLGYFRHLHFYFFTFRGCQFSTGREGGNRRFFNTSLGAGAKKNV